MFAKRIHIIRKDQFREGQPMQLPLGKTSPAVDTVTDSAQAESTGVVQARIVESNSDYVILEMICGCGQKSFVQCNYGNVSGSQDPQETQS